MKKLKQHRVDWAQIERFFASAEKKLASAHKILAFDEEACLQQACEAMLKASLGFMFSHGFRARSQSGHHIAIIDFVRTRLDKKHTGLARSSTVSDGREISRCTTIGLRLSTHKKVRAAFQARPFVLLYRGISAGLKT
jgi:hypothetical protein